ncbi:MAG TPA: low affinity iron permease family protein [Gemmataceae bacterium]|jgi:low affinity Fe/Cu permease|nr:low affinity iron permease family protein [Gemmataceae bacterium]
MGAQPEGPKTRTPGFERAVHALTGWLGSTSAFALVLVSMVGWYLSRRYFSSTEAWQNAIMLTLTILTFLLIFLLQRTQNKALLSIQLKLNELVAAQHGASNRLIDLENMSENDVRNLHRHYQDLASHTKTEDNPGERHSVEEAAAGRLTTR